MVSWQRVREFDRRRNLNVVQWWELLVKPGVKQLGLQRSKEIKKERNEKLNLLLLRQRYLKNKLQIGLFSYLSELKLVHMEIENWYIKESEKVQHQARVREFQEREKSCIYHHEIHKRTIKKHLFLSLKQQRV